jgi:hypothetical protein
MTTMRTVLSELTVVSLQFYQLIEGGRDRFQPFSMGFTGDAGLGKTTLVPGVQLMLSKAMRKLKCPRCLIDHDGRKVWQYQKPYTVTPGVDFDENARNDHWMVVFDDLGIITKEFQEKGAQNVAVKFMQVQASIPYSMNKANLAEKKGSFWGNTVTVATSNLPDFGLNSVIANDKAWKRRFNVIVNMSFLQSEHVPLTPDRYAIEGYYSFDVNWMNIHTQERSVTHCTSANQVLDLIVKLAIEYEDFREERMVSKQRHSLVCPDCEQTLHQCVCKMMPEEEAAGLWMNPIAIQNASLNSIIEMIVIEEALCYLWMTILLMMGCSNMMAFMLIACIREGIEMCVGKTFNLLRFVCLMFSLSTFPWSIFFHIILNGPIILQKMKLEYHMTVALSRYLNRNVDVIQNIVWNSVRPRFFDRIVNMRFSQLQTPQYVDKYKQEVAGLLGFSAITIALYCGLKYYGYTKTALGQEGTYDDQHTSEHLNAQVQGAPLNESHGKTSSNEWKKNVDICYKPSNGKLKNCVEKTDFKVQLIHPETGQPMANGKGFFSGQYFYTIKHLFDRLNVGRGHLKYWTNPQQSFTLDDVDLQAPHILQRNDSIAIPVSHSFKTLPLQCDYRLQHADYVWIDGEEVEVLAAYKFEGVWPLVYKVKKAGVVGLSGSMVVLTKKAGVNMTNIIVGIVVGFHNIDGLLLFEPFNSDVVERQKQFTMSCAIDERYLPPIITPDFVRDQLWKLYKVEVKPGMAPQSVLKHLPSIEGVVQNYIGEHVGTVPVSLPATDSKFYESEFIGIAREVGDVDKYTKPTMKPRVQDGVYHNSLLACVRQMNSCGQIDAESPFWAATRLLFDHIKTTLGDSLQDWRVYDVHTAIVGDQFMNGLNRDSAIGFPHHGIKDDIICGTFEKAYFKEQMNLEISQIIEQMDQGIPPLNISKSALKDEIITKKKNDDAQVRVFFGGNTSYLMLCRMYLGQLMNIFGQFREKLFCKIGLNAIGPEFDKMARNMYKKIFGTEEGFETKPCFQDGDFDKYDKVLLVLRYAIHLLWWLANEVKYFRENPKILNRIKMILTSMQQYIVIIGQDMFVMNNKIPSGLWGTAFINCLCECLIEILMFYFLIHTFQNRWFRCDFVTYYRFVDGIDVFVELDLSNYGDDNFKCIAQRFWPCYNHDLIMAFAKWIHMGITPARKTESKVEMKPITDVLFLKRVFVWNSHLKRFVGALEINSIAKMLAFSDTVELNKPQWRKCVLDTARRELSFHGPEVYYKFVGVVKKFAPEYSIKQTWEETLTEIDEGKWEWFYSGIIEPVILSISEFSLLDGQNLGPQNTIRHSL